MRGSFLINTPINICNTDTTPITAIDPAIPQAHLGPTQNNAVALPNIWPLLSRLRLQVSSTPASHEPRQARHSQSELPRDVEPIRLARANPPPSSGGRGNRRKPGAKPPAHIRGRVGGPAEPGRGRPARSPRSASEGPGGAAGHRTRAASSKAAASVASDRR